MSHELSAKGHFSFEKLEVWQKSIEFTNHVLNMVDSVETDRKHYRLFEQIENASASIAANIAEGKGRHSKKEFVHFLYVARGSLFEVVTFLTIFQKRKWVNDKIYEVLRNDAVLIGKMLSSLINKIK